MRSWSGQRSRHVGTRPPESGVATDATSKGWHMRLDSASNGWLHGLLRPPYGTSLSAVVLAVACFGAVAALHLLRPELDPARHVLSEYANGGHGVIMTAVFYGAGVACAALGWRLRSALDWSGLTGAVPALLMLAGVALIMSGVFEVGLPDEPESMAETIHSGASISAFVLMIAAMLLFARACATDSRWRTFLPIAVALAVTASAAAALSPFADGTAWTGVAQRGLGGAVLLWLLLTARRVRVNAFRPHG